MSAMDDQRGAEGRVALQLLELRQRLDAWDRLYNEEMGKLLEQLTRVTSDYLHLLQERQRQQETATRPARGRKRAEGGATKTE